LDIHSPKIIVMRLNKVQLIGYLGKDPLIHLLPTGNYFAILQLATSNCYSIEDKTRITTWHRVKYWGRKVSYLQNCFITGSHVMVEGTLVYQSYTDKDGIARTYTEIKADKLINLDR
jgi:single-strand DNA-binding protein